MSDTATKSRAPRIPNHEMIRAIGRGSYGEIWLARSLTGTWRAVKIVDRRTFESDKAFQREFEGMAKFEPISRGDAGFVDILHVGREEGGHFFYYVMELADDHLGSGRIDPNNYVPKTLKSELSRRSRLLADECVTIGLSLSKALAALHAQELVHRDIKPANIIFVGGVPKIADIGLVAASGQASFVGTEGYVPPEGPGTAQADIYSLGKVLYEIAMGKDRMDFPAVNTRLAELPDKAVLMQLNEVLLRACAHAPSARYTTAEEMHEDLTRLRDGRPLAERSRRRWPWMLAGGLAASTAVAFYFFPLGTERGGVRIETDPPGAMVVVDGDSLMRPTPAQFADLKEGPHSAHIMLKGYEPVDIKFDVAGKTETRPAKLQLKRSHGVAQLTSLPTGAEFELRQGESIVKKGNTPATIADLPSGEYLVHMILDGRELSAPLEIRRGETTPAEIEFASGTIAVTSTPPGAEIFADGKRMGVTPVELALAEGPHELVAKYRQWPEQKRSVPAARDKPNEAAFDFPTGSVKITSSPSGAYVFVNGVEQGRTPLPVEDVEPGEVRYELRLKDYKNLEVTGIVEPGKQTFLPARFVKRACPARGQPWENSLSMKFVPVGEILVGVWPVRVQDYEAFCAATGRARLAPDFAQDGTHPVVRVSWEDATAFCEWLTKREITAERLEEGQRYRLPTDLEWSQAAGLPEEGGNTPEQRDGKIRDYPWGRQWPPPAGAGNFADGPMKRGGTGIAGIPGYHDGFGQTSPVGSFAANRLGLYDMWGNVWQWCQDSYKGDNTGARDWGVLRGGSWGTVTPAELRSSYRNAVDRSERDVIFGFRCVLVPGSGS